MRGIGTPKIGSNIMNSHIKRPRMTDNLRIGSRKKVISGLHVWEIADKKTAYNEGRLYSELPVGILKSKYELNLYLFMNFVNIVCYLSKFCGIFGFFKADFGQIRSLNIFHLATLFILSSVWKVIQCYDTLD